MGGKKTQEALKEFHPLFMLNYSATHKEHHDLVYVLDALDAYRMKLVKKIEVKGFDIHNLRGTDGYLYLENIIISPKKPPMADWNLKSNMINPSSVKPVLSESMMICMLFPKRWNSIKAIISMILTRFEAS